MQEKLGWHLLQPRGSAFWLQVQFQHRILPYCLLALNKGEDSIILARYLYYQLPSPCLQQKPAASYMQLRAHRAQLTRSSLLSDRVMEKSACILAPTGIFSCWPGAINQRSCGSCLQTPSPGTQIASDTSRCLGRALAPNESVKHL